ncbi:MAG: Rieske 2Fe-2S domain-containing protein [Methylotenera sp.]|jgi:nitrite reductase/ring-hydroxylating ferredoxin subunit|uniref:Rieske (2Fe-2S) protein n=1 Tax=Methylotenera sp. TaxID=2051956 RepID=UPI0027165CE9|nr:Rieske 2Fe-2S domain-containing protein [Methylotenera sp.]MDO9149955.1 Rieske 2Fe-2S domain-containing protein [Methylotenera sp.]
MHIEEESIVIESSAVQEGGKGVRFPLTELGEFATGFVVRFNQQPYAYVNQCAHVSVELDWTEGEFFTPQGDYLICATHGAHYRPDNGFCVMGPCKGKSLKPIEVIEQNQKIIINIASISK